MSGTRCLRGKKSCAASEIVIDDLDTEGMTATAKGAEEKPGENVKRKGGLNRGIPGSGWGELERISATRRSS